ncbi:hypothetical protein E1J05_23470 [Phocaeicola dorei]|nr:hypothetical protein E1J05_23470 [Phocaeicola dorei]
MRQSGLHLCNIPQVHEAGTARMFPLCRNHAATCGRKDFSTKRTYLRRGGWGRNALGIAGEAPQQSEDLKRKARPEGNAQQKRKNIYRIYHIYFIYLQKTKKYGSSNHTQEEDY